MTEAGYVVALVGATSEIGREVRDVMRERAFPIAEMRLYDAGADDPDAGWTDEELEEVRGLDAVELEGADVAFLCAASARATDWAHQAADAGALAIDVTTTLAEADGAILVVPEVNADAIDEVVGGGLLVCPVPGAAALAIVLRPLHAAAAVKRVVVTALEPVSRAGREGIDELAQQTRDLFSGNGVEPVTFPHRIAFNLIPQVGDFVPGARTRGEWAIESQARRVLDLPDLPIAVTAVWVPTFFGHGYAVHVETEQPLDAAAARRLLRQSPGVMLSEAAGNASYPTLADVIGSEATHVGRLRDDPTVPFGLALWVAIDGLRKGAAVSAVQLAERALRGRR
jgi:aspartate-semialdehyde dehydrogenase